MKEDTERTPLRTILTNFLNHIDTLENQRTPDNTYESEFQELKLFSESIKGTKQYSCSEGEKEVNRKKNRYKDILPFDVSRVVLNEYAGIPGSDYINANFIKGASGSPAYIASQGPLPHTVNDFWRMVVQCEVQVIVMACNEEEAGKHKCENYWVEGEGEEKQFGMVSLRLIKASTVCPDFSVRTMRLKYTNTQSNTEERTVCQFHYSAWPDHGVPPLVRPLLDMVRLVRDTQASETLPVLIHCSAGCGRTGTICAIDYVWGLLRAGKLTKDFSLLSLVREMRKQRIAMVQTKEQYVLVHQAVRELFKEQLRMIDSHPYENIDCNGLPLIKCPSPEPTYDSVSSIQNNKTEEKQDEKEKEQAPPLPQKKRFNTLSSKQAKEVENLSERQRLAEQAGSSSESVTSSNSSGTRPRIATLRSLFERQQASRDTRQVARSHSLGSVRPPTAHPLPNPVEVKEPPVQKPIPGRGILRVPQAQPRPALPVKRSKSLRVLGSGDRCKLSIPPAVEPSCEVDSQRRLSLESNFDEIKDLVQSEAGQQPLSDYLSVDSIVAGLGVRERRNSFRQAVRWESQESLAPWPKKPGLLRSYTSVDMRSAREKPNLPPDLPPAKPLLRPKPNLLTKPNVRTNDTKKSSTDSRSQIKSRPQSSSNQPFTALSELKKSPLQASSSRTLMTHSMSLRLAPKPRREDCRILLSPPISRSASSHQAEQVYSSGESTMSGSSDQGLSSTKSSITRAMSKPQPFITKAETTDIEKGKQIAQSAGHPQESFNSITFAYKQDKANVSSGASRDQNQVPRQSNLGSQTSSIRSDQSTHLIQNKIKSSGDTRKNTPSQNTRPVIYNTKSIRQNLLSAPLLPISKVAPPPYVEPGKNAQKPRSSPHSINDKQSSNTGFYDEMYGEKTEQRHWQINNSRDMPQASHSSTTKPNMTGTDVRLSSSKPESGGIKYSRNVMERRPIDQDYRMSQDLYSKKVGERRPDGQEYRPSQELLSVHHSERRYTDQEGPVRNEKKTIDHDFHRSPQESGQKNVPERRHREQKCQPNLPETYPKPYSDRRITEQNLQQGILDPRTRTIADRREQDLKPSPQDSYYRSAGEKRVVNQEYRHVSQEAFTKAGDRRAIEPGFRSSPQESFPMTNERVSVDQDGRGGLQEKYPPSGERRPVPNYQSSSQEVYPKTPLDRRHVDHDYQSSIQEPRPVYMSRTSRSQDQGHWTPRAPADQGHWTTRTSANEPPNEKHGNDSETPASHGVKMRRGSRDDLALCATTPSRVKRHASVVMLRHSLIENANTSPGEASTTPLSVWNQTNAVGDESVNQATPSKEDPWSGAVGVDLDQVAASITSQKDGKMMRAALEALHLRKASQSNLKSSQLTPKPGQSTPKSSQVITKSSHMTPSHVLDPNKIQCPPPQFTPPPETTKPGPFRKQQQYL